MEAGSTTSRPVACECCARHGFVPRFAIGEHRYERCVHCGSARLTPVPTADPVELYDETYFEGAAHGGYLDYDADAALHRRNAEARLDRLTPYLPRRQPLQLLDLGCASGYTLDAARARGWVGIGVDASAFARERAAARGHEVFAELPAALGGDRAVHVASCFQVLEHLARPAEALTALAAAMEPGGVLVVETWDAASRVARVFGRHWQQANPPSVIHLFTLTGICRLVERAGFDVVLGEPTAKLVSAGLVAGVAAHRWGALGAAARTAADRTRLASVTVPYRLGDLVTIIATRRDAGTRPSR